MYNVMKPTLFGLLVSLMAMTSSTRGVITTLDQETFTGSAPGGFTDSGFSGAAGYNGGFGNTGADIETAAGATLGPNGSPSGAGSYEGSFTLQGVPAPETGVLTITDPGFATTYSSAYAGYTTYYFGFAFYGSVLPTDLLITVGSGMNAYVYNALSQISSALTWNDVIIPFGSGWTGSGSSLPDTIDYIDVSWSRNGGAAQSFFLDDFSVFGDDSSSSSSSSSGGPSAVPEPNTLSFIAFAMLLGLTIRRFRKPLKDATEFNNVNAIG